MDPKAASGSDRGQAPRMLVVCGMPRSGTRNFADILNLHEAITLAGEIPLAVMRKVFELADLVDEKYASKAGPGERWRAKRHDFLLQNTFLVAKGSHRLESDGHVYAGTKTPNLELLFDEFERFYEGSPEKPVYVFCARNPESCWKSIRSMPWSDSDLQEFTKKYNRSYSTLDRMRAAAPERTIVANLDRYIASEQRGRFVAEELFGPLGLELTDEQLAAIDDLPNRNATIRKTGSAPDPVPQEDLDRLAQNRRLQAIRAEYFPDVSTGR